MIKFNPIRKVIAILANVSLLFNSFIPFLLVAQPAYAQSLETIVSSINYDSSANKINVITDTSEKIAYQLFYKTNDKIDAIIGNDLNQADFYLGTCSTNSCLNQNIRRGILKIESNSNFYSQFFTLENNILTITKETESSQSDLTDEENNFLENKISSNWTFEKVELNKEYIAPQNSEVKLTFTKLPENSGNIKIEEITLTPEQIEQSGSLSDKAYDITSDMVDGTFAYNLSLPIPESVKGQNVEIKFAEEISKIDSAQTVDNTTETSSTVSAVNLNHFTVFMVVTKNPVDCSTGIYVDGSCYSTIKDAINNPATVDGSVINVKSGIYNENIIINKSISLVGEDKNNTIINGGNSGVVVTIAASNVTLKNFTVKDSGTNPLTDAGIGLNGVNNCTINSNIVTNNVTNIAVMSSKGNIISSNTISNSLMYGIVLEAGISGVYSTGNIISENIINANGRDGIYAGQDNNNNQILNNEITGTVGNSTYGAPEGNGIYLWKSAGNIVTGNNISFNATGYGIEMFGSKNNTITGNEIIGNLDGLHIRNINDIDYPGYSIKDNNISKNKIFGNTRVNLYASPNFNFNIEKNWWGSADKTTIINKLASWTSDGNITVGTTVYLDFDPWYINAEMTVLSDNSLTIPTITSPIGLINDNTPLMQWVDVAGATGYYYRVKYNCTDINNSATCGSVYPSSTGLWLNSSEYQAGKTNNGVYYWQVQSCNSSDNCSNWSNLSKITIDSTPPSIPTDIYYKDTVNNKTINCGDKTNTKHLNVYWNKNNDLDFDHYEYVSFNADGTTGPIRTFTDNYFNASWWAIPFEGTYGVQIRSVDKAGNKSSWFGGLQNIANSCKYIVDWTAPIITVNPFITNNKTPTLTGTVNDNTATVSVKVNGITYAAINNDNGTWKSIITPAITDGTYDVVATATDMAGNSGTDTNELTVDSVVPTAIYKHYINGDLFTGPIAYVNNINKLTFTGEYNDATPSSGLLKDSYVIFNAQTDHSFKFAQNGAKSYCSWRTEPNLVDGLSGTTFSLTNKESFNNCISNLGEGEYYMTHQVYDNATRQDIPSITQYKDVLGLHFIVDKTAPTSTISLPNNTGTNSTVYSNLGNGNLAGTASDTNGIKAVELSIQNSDGTYWNGSTWQTDEFFVVASGTENWTYHVSGTLNDGTYIIKSHAIDNADNREDTYTLNIILDKKIPEVSLSLNPTVGDAQNGWYRTQPEISFTHIDINFDMVEYQWDSQTGFWNTYSTIFKPVSEGSHVLYYRAIDKANNISNVGIKNINWDQTDLEYGPQNISANPNPTSGSTSKIRWEIAKDNIGIDKYEIQWKLNGGNANYFSKTVDTGTTEVEIDNLTEGRWIVRVIAFDQSGRSKDSSIDLNVGQNSNSVVLNTTNQIPSNEDFSPEVLGDSIEVTSPTPNQISESGDILGTTDKDNSDLWKLFYLLLIIPLYVGGRKIFKKR